MLLFRVYLVCAKEPFGQTSSAHFMPSAFSGIGKLLFQVAESYTDMRSQRIDNVVVLSAIHTEP